MAFKRFFKETDHSLLLRSTTHCIGEYVRKETFPAITTTTNKKPTCCCDFLLHLILLLFILLLRIIILQLLYKNTRNGSICGVNCEKCDHRTRAQQYRNPSQMLLY